VSTRNPLPAIDKPIPIRTPAQVMRAWIAPWEDTQGRAHGGGYTFVEIETRRWLFGESESTIEPVRFFSIQKTMDAKEPVGKDQRTPQTRAGTSERSPRTNPSSLSNQGAPNESSQHKVDASRR
jgi:conjugal transfer pilus assembly protein TraV